MGSCINLPPRNYAKNSPKETSQSEILSEKLPTSMFSLKRKVWGTYIGEDIGQTICLCCGINRITQITFRCAYVINGGPDTIDNIRPVCISCSDAIGTQNMADYMKTTYKRRLSGATAPRNIK